MAAKTLITTESSKTIGFNRLNDGTYTIKRFGRFMKPCDFNDAGEYEVFALFVDDLNDQCLELNGFWKPRKQLNADGSVSNVKAGGTLYDRILALTDRKTFDKACDICNAPENQLVGHTFQITWQEYTPASGNSSFGYIPVANIN